MSNATTPNDGSHHVFATQTQTLVPSVAADSDRNDEAITLAGADMARIYRHWADRGNSLRERSFFGGLAEVLLDRGHSHAAVCALFEAHDPSRACPDFVRELASYCPTFDPANYRSDFCANGCCEAGEGACDADADCATGLRCYTDNGALFGRTPSEGVDRTRYSLRM